MQKICHYIDFNIANMQKICKKYAKNMLNMQQKYATNMQNMHKSMYLHILHIYALPTLLMTGTVYACMIMFLFVRVRSSRCHYQCARITHDDHYVYVWHRRCAP